MKPTYEIIRLFGTKHAVLETYQGEKRVVGEFENFLYADYCKTGAEAAWKPVKE